MGTVEGLNRKKQSGADATVKPVVLWAHNQFSIDHLVDETILR